MSMMEPEDIAKWYEIEDSKLFEVKELETCIFDDNGVEVDNPKYWFACCKQKGSLNFKCADKESAIELCEFLNKECYFDVDNAIDSFVLDNCIEWSNLITDLSAAEAQLYTKKEQYEHESEKLLEDAAKLLEETEEDIIKAKYGGNNDKTRKKYVKDTLLNRSLEIKQIEFKISYYKRRISYLKSLVRVKTAIMEAKNLRP